MMNGRFPLLLAPSVAALLALCGPSSSAAATPSPQWTINAVSEPTNLPPGGEGKYALEVKNTGGAATDGTPITVSDLLPSGLEATGNASGEEFLFDHEMSCTGLTCTYSGVIEPDDSLLVKVPVKVVGTETDVTNLAAVTGGGAPPIQRETPTAISATPAPFGIAPGSTSTALSTTQAGAHADLSTSLSFNTDPNGIIAGAPKESGLNLPPGFVLDLADAPKCPSATFSKEEPFLLPTCAVGTQVGTVTLLLNFGLGSVVHSEQPLYNLTTNPGEIARIGFYASLFGVEGTITIRPGDYGGTTAFHFIRLNVLQGVSITVWGVPSASIHNALRGLTCKPFGPPANCEYRTPTEELGVLPNGLAVTSPPTPFFTNLTQCSDQPPEGSYFVRSWQEPEREITAATSIGPITGCPLMEFGPSITAAPDTTRADTPAGFTFNVKVPQEGLVSAEGLSSSDIENTTATLPVGVAINPGQAAGLAACQFAQDGIGVNGPPSCPSASRVGEVEVETPLITRPLKGPVYVLASNPPQIKLLVAPEDPQDGIYVKFIGTVHLNETNGQLVTTFEKTPELPFANLRLSFSGGAQAALSTPTGCGTYNTSTIFAPWSGQSEASAASNFAIESGTGGAPCPPTPLPFAPQMDAGATTDQAGGFTDFSLLLTRADDQQRISSLQFETPEGLLGEIAKVPLCGEQQANEGTCPAASQIGHTVVEAGPGPYPLVVPQPGKPPAPIYLTGSYKGAPFGLSIVVPLEVGPFVLKTQVVRAKIEVDQLTSRLTVTTDPFPTIINGVPADLRTIVAVIDRPEFMFNPTSCAPMSFAGSATSLEGTTVPISTHFQMGSCRALLFKPNFQVSTSAHTSRTEGASLDAQIIYPSGPLGANQASSQSNVQEVKVELPRQLPSRLTTLQKACPDTVFNANPANCPQASRIGEASAITPVLPVPLRGPAYFVSHGGAKFPELIMVISGYGVTVQLHGETFISKAGITSSTFKNVPDVPISHFELKLPEGPDSALAANGDLCAQTLLMPTVFTAQNGAVVKQNTRLSVEGCTPEIRVVRHTVKGKHATVVVTVPSAGTLVAGGHGLSRATQSVRGAGTVTVTLRLSKADQRFVVNHHGRRLMAPIRLAFTPSHGKRLQAQVAVLMR